MKDEDKTFENEVIPIFNDKVPNDLETVISHYKKKLYEMQQYESQAIILENQLKGTKAIVRDFAKAIKQLKEHNYTQAKEIDRLNEYVQILEMEKKN